MVALIIERRNETTLRKEIVIELLDLQPNNWFINRAKLERVREAWMNGEQDMLVYGMDGQE